MMEYLRALAERVLRHEEREAEKRDAERKAHDAALSAAADYMRDLDVRGVERSS